MKYEKNRKIAGIDEYSIMKFLKLLAIPAVAVLLIVIIVVADRVRYAGREEPEEETVEALTESRYRPERKGLEENAVSDINMLAAQYQNAVLTGDAAAFLALFGQNDAEKMEALDAKMKEDMKLYEEYLDTVVYTIPGVSEGSYLVYLRSEIRFMDAFITAPLLIRFYAERGEDGRYYMKASEALTEEEKEFIALVESSEEVRRLNTESRKQLAQAIISDANLSTAYQKVMGITVEGAPEEETQVEEAVVQIGGLRIESEVPPEQTSVSEGEDSGEGSTQASDDEASSESGNPGTDTGTPEEEGVFRETPPEGETPEPSTETPVELVPAAAS